MSTLSVGGRVAALLATVLLLTAAGASPASAATKKKAPTPTAATALRTLVTQTKSLPKTVTTAKQRRTLLGLANHARRSATAKPCTAVGDLARFRKALRAVKLKPLAKRKVANRRVSALAPASLTASRRLLASKKTKSCGGGVTPSTAASAKTTVMRSDANGMTLRVDLPAVQFSPETAGGQTWTRLGLPDTQAGGKPGTPGIPVFSDTFAVPDGAKITVKTDSSSSTTIDGVDVFPVQPEPLDQAGGGTTPKPDFLKNQFATKPFTVDKTTYGKDALIPAQPASGGVLGSARDLVIGNLQVPAAQYNPADKTLKLLKSVVVDITFNGGAKTFTPELNSPWERAQASFVGSLVNAGAVKSKLPFVIRRCGEEILIITNPATQAAADQLAVAKRAQGWRTNVFQTGSGAGQIGTTPAQIQAFIRTRLTALLCIHPSYVTILGDDDLVPTFTDGPSGIPSDLKYSLKTDADELPDLAVGRILGNDQAAVGTAVSKIVGYETTAPTGNGMLNKALVAAQFQDDDNDGTENRTFVTMAETVRNGLTARGVAVDRVYGESPGNNPQRFQDGSPLPAALLKPTFGWNGTGAQISAAWNEGRFLVVHRDHGWSDGWGTPSYGTADVQALTNGSRLPVLLSVNCSSGAYDYDETSFASEALVKANGGAVAVFGDTRDSPSTANTQMSLGFVDALLPSVLPSEGPASKQRLGDALNWGKMRLNGIAPLPDGTTRSEFYLWHLYGDPSMQMWGGGSPPLIFNPALITAIYKPGPISIPDPPPYEVAVNLPKELKGQPISLLRNGQVIGKAFAGDGTATIPAAFGDGSVKPGELEVAVEPDGGQPVKVPVTGVPESAPAPVATTLTQQCPQTTTFLNSQTNTGTITVTGKLTAAPAGSKVTVTFTGPTVTGTGPTPPPTVITKEVTTDASGNWTASADVQQTGNWSVSSSYAGTSAYLASSGGTCTATVASSTS